MKFTATYGWRTLNPLVVGSNPTGPTRFLFRINGLQTLCGLQSVARPALVPHLCRAFPSRPRADLPKAPDGRPPGARSVAPSNNWPNRPAIDVDGRPPKAGYVRRAQARGQAEGGHVAQVRRQLGEQPVGFIMRQVPYAARRLLQHADRRRAIEPLPLPHRLAQDRPHERERAVDRGCT